MNLACNEQGTSITMARILADYEKLIRSGKRFSLLTLLSHKDFRLDKYCKAFSPHPDAHMLKKISKDFCDHYGIWLPSADQYITCAMYLFPASPRERIIPIIKNNVVDFYLNERMGREVFNHLQPGQQQVFQWIRERMARLTGREQLLRDRDPSGAALSIHPVEAANLEALYELAGTSTEEWFDDFLSLYSYHVEVAHKDCNSSEYVPTPDAYIELRNHISGMPHTVMLVEYSTGCFLDRDKLVRSGIAGNVDRLCRVVSLIGCLMNDLFSFEKEVIDNHCDSNLVAVILLNNPGLGLREAILVAAGVVRGLLEEFIHSLGLLKKQDLGRFGPAFREGLEVYFSGLENCVRACWIWQAGSGRYDRPVSIWQEIGALFCPSSRHNIE